MDRWQPSFANIPLSTLQSALAHRFLDWFVTQNDDDDDQEAVPVEGYESAQHQTQEDKEDVNEDIEEEGAMAMVDDWVARHDLQWPEGDYYIAKKTFIREGVAHLKRGRRYIFVEPVLGPASSYLYPKWMDPEEEEGADESEEDEGEEEAGMLYHLQQHQQDGSATEEMVEQFRHDEGQQSHQPHQYLYDHVIDLDIASASSLPDHHDSQNASATEGELHSEEGDKGGVHDHAHEREDEGQEVTEEHEEEGRAHLDNKGVSTKGDKKETPHPCSPNLTPALTAEENRGAPVPVNSNINNSKTDGENSAPLTPSTSPVSTPANPSPNNGLPTPMSSSNPSSLDNSSTLPSHSEDHLFEHPQQSSTLHEPYSPLLDSSTDGQDQFEYGLYELHFIPKIQYLLPQEFLPTRQSFVVHLDEDRPTLASPVPAHSKRSECRCQLMMRKVLMHRDLQQVWPVIPPVRTIAERQQEAEEEARMKEIKEKVQLQSMQWRKALMTQTVACG
ncbi:hypothetical protein BGZ93_004463 [Podila epicladia]|nr:hypothetical protein BGZ92_007747 [Podila epicladia]KAG0096485.1 hypothetical protein BGZ93_004463 [Podila epicladia]